MCVCVCVCVCVSVTLNVVTFSWVNKYYIKKRTNIIIFCILLVLFFILFNNVNTNYTFHSVFMNFYIYSKIITKRSKNLNNILETVYNKVSLVNIS